LGERLVEHLSAGDLIITRDNGLQAIRWIGQKDITGARLFANPEICPIKIRKDAFSTGLPNRDMMTSPQHRVVINHDLANKLYGSRELLVPVKALTSNNKIATANIKKTTYVHMLFDHHEIIYANGVETESFHPNKVIMNGLEGAVQDEIYQIFPELRAGTVASGYGPTALPALSVSEGQILAKVIWDDTLRNYNIAS
jgi:hypothetical protein